MAGNQCGMVKLLTLIANSQFPGQGLFTVILSDCRLGRTYDRDN
jgi:hypothetical protein